MDQFDLTTAIGVAQFVTWLSQVEYGETCSVNIGTQARYGQSQRLTVTAQPDNHIDDPDNIEELKG